MPTPTYDLLASSVLTSSASSVTFDNLDTVAAGYRDLVLVMEASHTADGAENIIIRFNNDSGSNYSNVEMFGTGSSALSFNSTGANNLGAVGQTTTTTAKSLTTLQIIDFSATDKHKTGLSRNSVAHRTHALTGRWANTSAITIVNIISTGTMTVGSSFYLYGIAS